MPRLNDTYIKQLVPDAGKTVIHRDDVVRGLGVRVTPNNARSFVLGYTVAGRERRMTIGEVGVWTTAQAREEARRLRRLIDTGIDPLGKRIEEREAPTVNDLAKRFLEEHAPKNRESYRHNNEILL